MLILLWLSLLLLDISHCLLSSLSFNVSGNPGVVQRQRVFQQNVSHLELIPLRHQKSNAS